MTQSINPKIWGPSFWSSMIYVALGYPQTSPSPQMKQQYENYFRSLTHVLPCQSCQQNYQKHLAQHPPDLQNQETLLQWLLTIYNLTLQDQNRTPLRDAQTLVRKYAKSNSVLPSLPQSLSPLTLFLISLIVATIIYFFYYRRSR